MARKAKTPKWQRPLSLAERTFCHKYLELGCVATKAAEAAGLKRSRGGQLLKDERVQAYIDKLQRERTAEADLSAGKVIAGLVHEAEHGHPSSARVAAWSTLAKVLGITTENHNVRATVEAKGQVLVYLPDNGRGTAEGTEDGNPADAATD